MIKALENLDKMTAVGILARAALSLEHGDGPRTGVTKEEDIQAHVVDEVRSLLGIAKDDNTSDAVDKVADVLDDELDKLLAPPDTKAALQRMAERGDLPSDLYEINIIKDVVDNLGKGFPLERDVIETTIRSPTAEQHFGPGGEHEPPMVSLFLRYFRTKWPLKDFFMLVAAQRDGLRLHVHQAWRIYPSIVNVSGAATLVDWLKKFADYGLKVEVDGKKENFFLFVETNIPQTFEVDLGPHQKVTVSRFASNDLATGKERAALIVAIDKYLNTLDQFGVRRNEFLDNFVPAPAS